MKKQSFIQSSLILIVSVVLSKLAGALFRIPLAGMLGGTGMSYFSGAYGLFLPVYAVFVTGLSAASAKLTAESKVLYGISGVKKVKRCSVVFYFLTGVAGTLIMALLARPFALYIAGNKELYLSVLVISPAVLFSCISAAYRGCAEGSGNMYPTAVSQTLESIIKLAAGLFICSKVMENSDCFSKIFSGVCSDSQAIAAAGAAAGITVSAFLSMIFVIIYDALHRKSEAEDGFVPCSKSGRVIAAELTAVIIPLAVSSLMTNLTSLIDLCTITRYIKTSFSENCGYFISRYRNTGITDADEFSKFAYGSFSGMAVTVFNLVPSFTNMFGKSIFPGTASAWAEKNKSAVKNYTEEAVGITALAAVPAGLGICILSERILAFLFPSSSAETEFCAEALSYMGIGVIFLCISYPVFCILQSAGRADVPAWIMLAGAAVKFIGNIVLVRISSLNVSGAAISTVICYAAVMFISFAAYKKCTGISAEFMKTLSLPVYAGLMFAGTCWLAKRTAEKYLSGSQVLFVPLAAGAAVWLTVLYLTGGFRKIKEMSLKK